MTHRRALLILTVLVLAYTAGFTTLHQLRYRAFFSHDWRDEAVDNQIIYNSAKGDLVFSTVKGPNRFHRHFRPIFVVAAIPWLLNDTIQTWFVTVSLVLALGAFAIYGFVRRRFGSVPLALGFATVYLLWQPLHEVTLGNYDPETLVATFWLFAALAYDKERPLAFWAWVFMALICKETMTVVLFGIGVMALLHRRKITWWLPPLVVAPVWFFTTVKFIIPLYFNGFDWIYDRFIGCGETGNFPICFFQALIADPAGALAQVFSREHLILLEGLFRGVAFNSIFGIEWLIPVAALSLESFLLSTPHVVRQAHVLSGMLPFIFLGAIVGAGRLAGWVESLSGRKVQSRHVLAVLLAVFFALNISLVFGTSIFGKNQNYGKQPFENIQADNIFDPQFYQYTDKDKRAWETIALIRDGADVMSNSRFLLAMSSRPVLREFGVAPLLENYVDEYILISFTQPPCRTCTYAYLTLLHLDHLSDLVKTGQYRVVRAFDDHALLIRNDLKQGPPQTPEVLDRFVKVLAEVRAQVEKNPTPHYYD